MLINDNASCIFQITGVGKDLEQGIFGLAEVEKEGGERESKVNGVGTANGTRPKDTSERDRRKARAAGGKKNK